jgi:signal transduction histidine kinase
MLTRLPIVRAGLLFRALLLGALVPQGFAAPAESLVLTQAMQVLRLSVEEAKQKVPVRLRGVVITGRDLPDGMAVVHDDSGSVFVLGAPAMARALTHTNLVELRGVADPGEFARRVVATEVWVLGRGEIPPAKRVTYDELLTGQLDSQWVELQGCLRSCIYLAEAMPSRRGGMEAELATGGGRLVVEVFDRAVSPNWVDGMLCLRGLCFHKFNQKRQFYQMYLVVPEGEPVLLERPPAPLPELPTNRVDNLLQFSPAASFAHRVRVQGTVTYQHPSAFLYLNDGERGLLVRTAVNALARVGDKVSVVGFPAQGDYSPILEDASFEVLGHDGPLPVPIRIQTLADAFQHDAELITGRAGLIGSLRQEDGWVLSMQMDNAVFMASLLRSGQSQAEPKLELGSELAFTGICSVIMGPLMPRNPLHAPQSFRLLLRSADDLKVIRPPPWWTRQRILITATIVVLFLTACVALILLFARTRLQRQQMGRRAAEAEFSAILKERNRMAREIHDTLAQDLSGISAQLEVARKKLPSGSEGALTHLDLAHATARNSLQEARRSIWNMRSQVLEDSDLGTALPNLLEREARAAGVEYQADVYGEARSLPSAIENDVLRIGQEAIHNAIRHAKPKTIKLSLGFGAQTVTLSVRDDGCGFNVDDTRFIRKTRFGLKGMRERALLHGGQLDIRSAPGQGTSLTLVIPLV